MPAARDASIVACAFAALVFAVATQQLHAGETESFRSDLRQLCAAPTRIVGSEGYANAARYLEHRIRSLSNVEFRREEFPVLVPITDSAELRRKGDSSTFPIYPFWPAQVRLNATPQGGISGRCVYIGDARYDQIVPAELSGQIAVCNASARERWVNAFYFGAKALLVLGDDETTYVDLRSHELTVPVNLPRFYVPQGKLNDELRNGRIRGTVTVTASAHWGRVSAVNLFALMKSPRAAGPALVITVPFDSSGFIPQQSPGASQAVQPACALALLEHFAHHPPDRPILFCFTGADSINQRGTRELLMTFADVPAHWKNEVDELLSKIADANHDLDRLIQIAANPTQLDVRSDRGTIDRIARLIETDAAIEQDELFRLRRDSSVAQSAIDQLQSHQSLLNRLRFTFQQRPEKLNDDLKAIAKIYIDRTIAHLRGEDGLIPQYHRRLAQLESRVRLYQWLARAIGGDPNPSARSNDRRLIELLISLDLSDHGRRVGPMFTGKLLDSSNLAQIQDYRDWFTRTRLAFKENRPQAKWWGDVNDIVDLAPFNGAHSPGTWLSAPLAIGSELCPAWGVPGFTLMTLNDLRLRRDTPTDTLEHVNADAIMPQLDAVIETIDYAWRDPTFRGPSDLPWQRTQLTGQVVSPAPGKPVPDLPRRDFLVTYHFTPNNIDHIPKPLTLPWVLGTRRAEVVDTDADGNWRIEGLPRVGDQQFVALQAYHCEPKTGEIIACSDLGKQLGDISPYADLRNDNPPMRNVVFSAEQFSLVGLYDPRYLQDLDEITLLDARRNAEPQRFNAILADRMLAGFVEPGARTHVLLRFGRVGNRLILINAGASGDVGFTPSELEQTHPLALATSKDFQNLNGTRLEEYRRAGVASPLIDSLQSEAANDLAAAESAIQQNKPASTVMKDATAAWSNAARVYAAAQDMANDVVRGAIFLLLLCVPFAFCMERLLVAATNVYRQIAGASAIFVVMTIALWSFHPAFSISASPLIIVLAFAILFMSALVIFVIYRRFNAEMTKIRSGGATSGESISFARAAVLSSAVLLGIANMRRRRFRTALTSITIVLITFALLCFTGATRYLDTTSLPTGIASSYPGIMIRQRGVRPLPTLLLENLKPLFPDEQIVEHWWNTNPADPREMINVTANNRTFAATAAVGISPGESRLSQISNVIGEKQFARLETGERDILYVSRETADQLRIKEGDQVVVGGLGLTLAGTYDARQFDRQVRTLSGEPIAPLKYESALLDASGRSLGDVAAESLDLDTQKSSSELGATYERLSSNQFFIVPAQVSQLLPNPTLRTISVRIEPRSAAAVHPDDRLHNLTRTLARRFSVALFAGYSDGVRMVSATNLARVNGVGQIAIPLIIAALIIFNTMLGSIAERRREIHVYTSLGLAPLHVGALFVAEACVYGLIGVVFGYIVGQAVGTGLLKLGWLGHVMLNYSGTAAILTMSLVLIVVIAAALIPARIASQIATPAIERTWKVPPPIGDTIATDLPFTINRRTAASAMSELADFFQAHREGTIGKFVADDITAASENGSRSIHATVWLTPFDLGVRQHVDLRIAPGDFADIYQVKLTMKLLSGDTNSWRRANRTFLAELRKQFLQFNQYTPPIRHR